VAVALRTSGHVSPSYIEPLASVAALNPKHINMATNAQRVLTKHVDKEGGSERAHQYDMQETVVVSSDHRPT
jgi:hypothetical protein